MRKGDSEITPCLSVQLGVIEKKNSSLMGSRTEGGEGRYG